MMRARERRKFRSCARGAGIIAAACGVCLASWLTIDAAWAESEIRSAVLIGMAGAYSGAPDEPAALWLNPAIIAASSSRGSLVVSYRRLYELTELEEISGAVRQRLPHGFAVGGGLHRFGMAGLYRETQGTLAAACVVRPGLMLGAGWHVQRVEYGDGVAVFGGSHVDFGAAAIPRRHLLLGLSLSDVSLDRLYADQGHSAAASVSAAWSVPPDVTLAGIWSRQSDRKDRWGFGQRLRLADGVEFLSGLSLAPTRYSLGGRLSLAGGSVDYSYRSDPELGGTHAIGFGWRW